MSTYLTFFELEMSPFDTATRSKLVLGTKALRSAYAEVERGLEHGSPRICVSGKAGMGKTCLARALPKLLGDKARTVLLVDPTLPWTALRAAIVKQWGLEDGILSRKTLIKAMEPGGRLTLIIDQAECISKESLEHLDILLSYLSDDDQQIVHGVLFANLEQAAWEDDSPLLWWLDSLTTLQLEFSPIPASGVANYIHKHLKRAGWKGENLFTPKACSAIHYMTGGVPRAISGLCERVLEEAARRNFRQVEPELIEEVCGEAPAGSAGYGDATEETTIEPLGPPITTPAPNESSVVNALADQPGEQEAMGSPDPAAMQDASSAAADATPEAGEPGHEQGEADDADTHATSRPDDSKEGGMFKPLSAPISLDSFFGGPPAEPMPAIAPQSLECDEGSKQYPDSEDSGGRKRRLAIAASILVLGGAGSAALQLGLLDAVLGSSARSSTTATARLRPQPPPALTRKPVPAQRTAATHASVKKTPDDEAARKDTAKVEPPTPPDPSPPQVRPPTLAGGSEREAGPQNAPPAANLPKPKPRTLASPAPPERARPAVAEPNASDEKTLAEQTAADAPSSPPRSPVPASPAPAIDRRLPAAPDEPLNPAELEDGERYW